MSFLSKTKNIKSFTDFKQKVRRVVRGRVEICRRNTSFLIHDWLVSLIHGKHRSNVFDFNISQEDVDQLLKVLDSSKQQKISEEVTARFTLKITS